MATKKDDFQARQREVDSTLNKIEELNLDEARCILRCIATSDAELGSRAMAMVTGTIRETYYKTEKVGPDGTDARESARNRRTARKNWQDAWDAKIKAQAASEATANTSRALVPVSEVNYNSSDDDEYGQSGYESDTAVSYFDKDAFDRSNSTRVINRGGQVTINNTYYVNGRNVGPRPPKPEWILCGLCDDWYLEEDNVLQDNDKPPCGYHTGMVLDYGNNAARAYQDYGVRRTGEAWNCCRRAPNSAGCHPAYHEPSEC